MRPPHQRGRGQRGMIYVMSLLCSVVLGILGSTMLMRAVSEKHLSERSRDQAVAFQLADAAVDQAALNLRTPTDLADDINAGTLPTGAFTIDSPPTQVTTNVWKATGHGTSTADPAYPATVEAVFQLIPQSVFQFAMFGNQQVLVSGDATTDSFNSATGPYNDDPDSPGYNAGHDGDIGTNATAPGGVDLSGSIFIDGQVAVGPNVADPTSVVTEYDPAFITGTPKVSSMASAFSMPPVAIPPELTCADMTVKSDNSVTLPPGQYCYQNLKLSGNSTLTASGPVTIYLTGSLLVSGDSVLGVVDDPTKVTVLMASNTSATLEQGSITGRTTFYGGLYGPAATINITGTAEVYGSIVADRVNLTGDAEIHYDQALTNNTQISNQSNTALRYWKKL